MNNIVIIGPNEGNIVQVSTTNDDEHFNITANPISFHYTKSYMAQLNGLDGAASGAFSSFFVVAPAVPAVARQCAQCRRAC